jgi:hypothetical protein
MLAAPQHMSNLRTTPRECLLLLILKLWFARAILLQTTLAAATAPEFIAQNNSNMQLLFQLQPWTVHDVVVLSQMICKAKLAANVHQVTRSGTLHEADASNRVEVNAALQRANVMWTDFHGLWFNMQIPLQTSVKVFKVFVQQRACTGLEIC